VTILDASILLYAYNADAPQHKSSRRWLENLYASPDWIGLPWLTLWAFIRISTNPRLSPIPLPAAEAFQIVRMLLAQPNSTVVEPGPRHAGILERLVEDHQATGPLLTDAVLAALAVEHGATLASTDRGFARFQELHWVNPLGRPVR
jgi:toxin-antitoxin system PIN domain toxin